MKKVTALILAVLLIFSITACSGQKPETASAAPDNGTSAAGKTSADPHSRSAYDAVIARNDITLVTVLATWSTPCEDMITTLKQVSESMKKVGVVALISDGVDETSFKVDDETMSYARDLLAEKEADFPIIAPDKELFDTFCTPTDFYPTSYIVDGEGRIISSPIIAAADAETVTEAITAVLESVSSAD